MGLSVCHHGKQASARVIVLAMLLKMRGKFINALSQYGNLHFRRTGILVMNPVLANDFLLFGLRNHEKTIAYLENFYKSLNSPLIHRGKASEG